MSGVRFFNDDIKFVLPKKRILAAWIKDVISKEGYNLGEINYVFCTDEALLQINQQYLQHDTFTDIITFDQSEEEGIVSSDIYISLDRVKENAKLHSVSFHQELHRVLIHGILHLIGYTDKTTQDKSKMRQKEDTCLSLLNH